MLAHENPFRSERIESLAFRAPSVSANALLDALRRQGGRGALVGPKGSGKTTLLEALAEALRQQGHPPVLLRLNESHRRLDWSALGQCLDSATPPPVLVDGAEQLGRLAWWRLRWTARRAPLVLITTHRPGRLPLLHRHATSPGLLADLVQELLRGSVPALPPPSDAELRALFAHCGGDVRRCFRALYDHAAAAEAARASSNAPFRFAAER